MNDNRNLIISKLICSKYYLFNLNNDIRHKIYLEIKDYYKQIFLRSQINKIFNSLNYFSRCYYLINNKKIIYKNYKNGCIIISNINDYYYLK